MTYDHRGIGRSSAPSGRYTTSLLAQDALQLIVSEFCTPIARLECLLCDGCREGKGGGGGRGGGGAGTCWANRVHFELICCSQEKALSWSVGDTHLLSVSMGGMVALELLATVSERGLRFKSATLIVTQVKLTHTHTHTSMHFVSFIVSRILVLAHRLLVPCL